MATTITLEELITLSRKIVKKYHDDDPELWDIVEERLNYIAGNGKLEPEDENDEEDEFSNYNLIYTLSRKYCNGEEINDMQPLYELWNTAS